MVEPPQAEKSIQTILSNKTARPPGSERAKKDNQTMSALLNLRGKKHTILILHQFATGDGQLRFSDLEEAADIAPNTPSNRLDELTGVGSLTRRSYNGIPPCVEYEATEKATELAPAFWFLGVWTERHDLEPIGQREK